MNQQIKGRTRYGQTMEYLEFEKEVAKLLKQYVMVKVDRKGIKLTRKLWREGYSVADTVGFLIITSK